MTHPSSAAAVSYGEKNSCVCRFLRHLGRGALSRATQLHAQLGCEHMFPDELKVLTPVEEKLIALNSLLCCLIHQRRSWELDRIMRRSW